jgi:hypothetical protein
MLNVLSLVLEIGRGSGADQSAHAAVVSYPGGFQYQFGRNSVGRKVHSGNDVSIDIVIEIYRIRVTFHAEI